MFYHYEVKKIELNLSQSRQKKSNVAIVSFYFLTMRKIIYLLSHKGISDISLNLNRTAELLFLD